MSKHTPAPWVLEIFQVENYGDLTAAEIGENGRHRGKIARLQSAEHINGIAKDELIANARLIAAAPDMLAALERIAAFLDRTALFFDESGMPGNAGNCAIKASEARAAIAKATGDL